MLIFHSNASLLAQWAMYTGTYVQKQWRLTIFWCFINLSKVS